MAREYAKYLVLVAVLALTLVSAAAMAQTPADAVAGAVAGSGVFPLGTSVVSVTVDGGVATIELSAEAAPADIGDALVGDEYKAIGDALADCPDITSIVINVAGKELGTYIPAPLAPAGTPGATTQSVGVMSVGAAPSATVLSGPASVSDPLVAPTSSELVGKKIALHPSHGTYYVNYTSAYKPIIPPWWNVSQRTLCGPNPVTGKAPGDPRYYQPSDYYYYTKGFQWPSMYEDDISPETIRFLKAYLESSGALVYCSRELNKNAGDFDPTTYGYLAAPFPTPLWRMAAMYNLRAKGYPEWIWSAFVRDYDADIRARPYLANYELESGLGCDLSFSLHSNAAGAGAARGTETYVWDKMYPVEQTRSKAFGAAMNAGVVNAINGYFDDTYAKEAYVGNGSKPVEWPYSYGYWGYTSWYNRGDKYNWSNFGEIREAKMPACLTEIAFHDDWKFYPDELFLMDQIWRAHAAWGFYEGICNFFGLPIKPRLAASVDSVSFPTLVGPNAAINGTIAMKNLGMVWCWGNKFTAASKTYDPYTVWFLKATADDQFGAAGTEIAVANDASYYPGNTATFNVSLTAPATTGLYTTSWRMIKDDAKGGDFGDVATAQIQVDADPPVITITSPTASNYAYGQVKAEFSAVDALSSVASVSADIDGVAVTNGQVVSWLSLGNHTLTVTAADIFGNSTSQSVTFSVVNSAGLVTVGGWVELADKKATCGFTCQYAQGDPAPIGNLTYQDHDTGMTVKSDSIVAMGIVGNHAWFYGTCTVDGAAGHWFQVDVIDNGEPGSNDVFNIQLDTGYSKGDKLGGGNVTIH